MFNLLKRFSVSCLDLAFVIVALSFAAMISLDRRLHLRAGFLLALAFVIEWLLMPFVRLLRWKPRTSAAFAMAFALAGCQTAGQLTSTVSSFEAQVQADTNFACSFIPTATTIASVVANLAAPGVGGAAVADAGTIATTMCNAILAASAPVQSAKLRSLRGGVALGVNVSVGKLRMPSGKSVAIQGAFTQ